MRHNAPPPPPPHSSTASFQPSVSAGSGGRCERRRSSRVATEATAVGTGENVLHTGDSDPCAATSAGASHKRRARAREREAAARSERRPERRGERMAERRERGKAKDEHGAGRANERVSRMKRARLARELERVEHGSAMAREREKALEKERARRATNVRLDVGDDVEKEMSLRKPWGKCGGSGDDEKPWKSSLTVDDVSFIASPSTLWNGLSLPARVAVAVIGFLLMYYMLFAKHRGWQSQNGFIVQRGPIAAGFVQNADDTSAAASYRPLPAPKRPPPIWHEEVLGILAEKKRAEVREREGANAGVQRQRNYALEAAKAAERAETEIDQSISHAPAPLSETAKSDAPHYESRNGSDGRAKSPSGSKVTADEILQTGGRTAEPQRSQAEAAPGTGDPKSNSPRPKLLKSKKKSRRKVKKEIRTVRTASPLLSLTNTERSAETAVSKGGGAIEDTSELNPSSGDSTKNKPNKIGSETNASELSKPGKKRSERMSNARDSQASEDSTDKTSEVNSKRQSDAFNSAAYSASPASQSQFTNKTVPSASTQDTRVMPNFANLDPPDVPEGEIKLLDWNYDGIVDPRTSKQYIALAGLDHVASFKPLCINPATQKFVTLMEPRLCGGYNRTAGWMTQYCSSVEESFDKESNLEKEQMDQSGEEWLKDQEEKRNVHWVEGLTVLQVYEKNCGNIAHFAGRATMLQHVLDNINAYAAPPHRIKNILIVPTFHIMKRFLYPHNYGFWHKTFLQAITAPSKYTVGTLGNFVYRSGKEPFNGVSRTQLLHNFSMAGSNMPDSTVVCFREAIVPGYFKDRYFADDREYPSEKPSFQSQLPSTPKIPRDALRMRERMSALIHKSTEYKAMTKRVVYLDRGGSRRMISAEQKEKLKSMLEAAAEKRLFKFEVVSFDDINFQEQFALMETAGIAIGVHGANLVNTMFMVCLTHNLHSHQPILNSWAKAL